MLWLLIIICIGSFIGIIIAVANSTSAAIAIMCSYGFIASAFGILDTLDDSPEIYEYKASEYTLEYKITTVGEQSDTTYVLTKIKED